MSTHVRTVDNQLTMNGEKLFVNNGEYAPALLVAAIDEDAPKSGGHAALSMWMIPCSTPGITAVPEDKDPGRRCFRSRTFNSTTCGWMKAGGCPSLPGLLSVLRLFRIWPCFRLCDGVGFSPSCHG